MGCWNETCSLTNLPIFVGDDIVVLIVAKIHTLPGKNCYYNDDANIFALPIYGKYNDYGGIDDVVIPDVTRKMLESFQFYCAEGDHEVIQETLEELIESICHNDVCIKYTMVDLSSPSNKSNYTPISALMYHKEAYELVKDEIANRTPYDNAESYWKLSQRRFLTQINSKVNFVRNAPTDGDIDNFEYHSWAINEIWRNSIGYNLALAYVKLVYQNKCTAEALADALADADCFCVGLDLLRKSFFGISGIGSQSSETHLHKILSEWTINHLNKIESDDKSSLFFYD